MSLSRAAGEPSWTRDRYLLLFVCFAMPLLARLYTLQNPASLSVDEAQWTVSARRVLEDPIVWRSTDLTTSGPLNALALAWPYLFGHIPTIGSSRLTGLVLQSASLFGIATLLRRGEIISPAAASILLSAGTLALSIDPNFIHASSEDVPITLMVIFGVTFAGLGRDHGRLWRWAVCGLTASCLPFAKLQSAPAGMLFHAVCAGRLLPGLMQGRESWRNCLIYGSAAILPALVLVAPLYAVGEQQAFWTGYLGLGAGYVGARTLEVFRVIGPQIVLDAALLWWTVRPLSQIMAYRAVRWDLLLLAILLWPTIFLIIWLPGRPFYHYNLYALTGLPLSVALAQHALPPGPPSSLERVAPAVLATLVAGLAAAVCLLPDRRAAFAQAHVESRFAAADDRSRPLMAWAGVTQADRLFMWGWEPEITAYADLKSGDRAAQGEYLVRPNPGRDYFRARLLKDWSGHEPAMIMDAVRPPYFFTNFAGINALDYTLKSFPALNAIVSRDYRQLAGSPDCAALYLRKDFAAALQNAEIPLHSTAPQLVDNSMTEKCGDWWAPDASQASATLTLAPPERIAEIWVLASRGGQARDRGTTRIRVSFLDQAQVSNAMIVQLADYPRWTVIPCASTSPILAITIEAIEAIGKGPALNEVKAFRKRP